MYFDPSDNLFGAPLWVWLVVGLIGFGPFCVYAVWGLMIDRRGHREWMAEVARRERAHNDPESVRGDEFGAEG